MDVIDAFKSLGFVHTRQTNYAAFSEHVGRLKDQGLEERFNAQIDDLARLGVIDTKLQGRIESAKSDKRRIYDRFFVFWREAVKHLIDSSTFTFEDQKYFAFLHESKSIAEGSFLSGAAAYSHVLVDEFQDINALDLNLLTTIVDRSGASLTVVGDDDQAIFEWRGASPEYILQPDQFLGRSFSTFKTGVNYRSPANIVNCSQRLIRNNVRRVEKSIAAARDDDAQITVLPISDYSQAVDVVDDLLAKARSGDETVAIIGRKRSQIIPFQVDFVSKGVDFCAAEDLQVFLSETFDSLINLLDIKAKSGSDFAGSKSVTDALLLCSRVKRFPLSKSDKAALQMHLTQGRPKSLSEAADELRGYSGPLKGKKDGSNVALDMADAIKRFLACSGVAETLQSLGENFQGLQKDFGKAEDDIFFADPPFGRLSEYARRYGSDYERFIADIEAARDELVLMPTFHGDGGRALENAGVFGRPVHLMTAPRAKGREFDYVVLLDAIDGIWPIRKSDSTDAELEAERRMFYVAFTRTRKEIVMLVNQSFGGKMVWQSPYIAELGI